MTKYLILGMGNLAVAKLVMEESKYQRLLEQFGERFFIVYLGDRYVPEKSNPHIFTYVPKVTAITNATGSFDLMDHRDIDITRYPITIPIHSTAEAPPPPQWSEDLKQQGYKEGFEAGRRAIEGHDEHVLRRVWNDGWESGYDFRAKLSKLVKGDAK